MTIPELSAEAVDRAAEVLGPVVRRTPLRHSARLSDELGVPVLLKREDQQLSRSYKARGAYHLIAGLTATERERGVVCASAGNHGQGLAYACATLGIRGRVFVPQSTPRQKRERITMIGKGLVELVLVGSTYDEASAAAHAYSDENGSIYVHPFDDPRTIVGQGTIAPELIEQATEQGFEVGTVVVPIGGGGLISGIALWLKANHPEITIIGVEPEGAASMTAALKHGVPTTLDALDTFVDGAAVATVGALTWPVVRDLVDDVVTVSNGALCTEMLNLYQIEGVIAEPAGALATTAVRQLQKPHGAVVAIVSGGNNDVSRYAEIVERSLLHEGLRHYFLVTFPQEPGALRHFLDEVLSESDDIVVFEYVKKNNRETGPALVGIELESAAHFEPLLARMEASPLTIDLVPPGSPVFSFLL